MRLAQATLAELPGKIRRPTYNRLKLTPGIVHIGLGNFHRAHQAWYLHRLMEVGEAHDWAIVGAGVRPNDEAQRKLLADQDYLTTLIELDPNGRSAEVVGSMIGYVPVQEDNAALIDQMALEEIRIVSLTVTESGYYIDPATKRFDDSHPDILHDAQNAHRPRTAFGAIVSALSRRREQRLGPFTCLSCDNLQGNGNILKNTVLGLARLYDNTLADWIETNGAFPNSMVDCIVPATGAKELKIASDFGVHDAAPVTHENFRQWVIEDSFCAGRPAWEKAGATFTENVHAFEAMKIRILNGGHQLIANAGEVLSLNHISECMEHPLIGAYFHKVAGTEISAHVSDVPGMSTASYVDLIHDRFSNAEIVDTVRRVAFDGSARHTGFILPTLQDALAANSPWNGLALSQAIWARMCEGKRENGSTIEANDPNWESLTKTATDAKFTPRVWLEQKPIYGDLAEHTEFVNVFSYWLNAMSERGVTSVLSEYLEKSNS